MTNYEPKIIDVRRIIILSAAIFLSSLLHAQVVTWQGPENFMSDIYYTVKVNGTEVPVYDTPIASYAVFDFTGEVTVEVSTMYDVRWVDIRPLRREITPEYTGDNSFSFNISEPGHLSLELNGRIRQQPLFIFSNAPETDIPSRDDENVIWFEGGKIHEDVRLELDDNQTVYIEGGAVVQGFISAKDKKNVRIMGRGILDGTYVQQMEKNTNRFIRFNDCSGITIEDIILHNGTTWQIACYNSTDIEINNVRIVSEDGGDDGMDIVQCRDVLIDGVFAHTKDDCIAIKSFSRGELDPSLPTANIVVQNCVFWNSIWGNAIEIGFELYTDEVKNIVFQNIDIIHCEDGAAMSIHNSGPADVKNIVFKDIRVEDCRQKLFDVAVFMTKYGPDGYRGEEIEREVYMHGAWDNVQKVPEGKEAYHDQFRGTISNVVFMDIQVTGGMLPFSVFHGWDQEHNVSGVLIEDLTYLGKKLDNRESAKIRAENTEGLEIR